MSDIARIDLFVPAFLDHGRLARAWQVAGGSALRRAAALGGLGVISAILSNLFPGPHGLGYPALPGAYFGLVLVAGAYGWATRKPLELLVIFAATNIAWYGAYEASLHLYPAIEHLSPAAAVLCGLMSGLIGSLITSCAIAYACKEFRTRAHWSRTLAIGALAGVLLQEAFATTGSFLLLYVVWQTAIAASIAYGLAAPRAARV